MAFVRSRQFVVAMMILLIIVALAIGYFAAIIIPRRHVAAFDQFMAASRILGKSPTQIIAAYGKPDYDTLINLDSTLPKNHRVMSYEGPDWESCYIEFIDGKAVKTNCAGK